MVEVMHHMENILIVEEERKEQNRFWLSVYLSFIITVIIGLIKFAAWSSGNEEPFFELGVLPRNLSGLKGIALAPLIHGDASHYFGNAIPFFVLSTLILYFYQQFYFRILLIIWFLDGAGVWLIGREVYHIGASGVVYGLAFFTFFSGVLKKNRSLLAVALLVLFLYGSIIWGILPLENGVSWEAHLVGFMTGTFLAVYYRNSGPKDDPLPEWMNEESGKDLENINEQEITSESNEERKIIINYDFKKKDDETQKY
jgi:membrane associated rhomboid family serine protease